MSRFRFALEAVLKVRRHRLERERIALADAQRRCAELERLEGETRRDLVTVAQGVEQRTRQGIPGGELAVWSEQSDRLRVEAGERRERAVQAGDLVDHLAGEVRGAHADVRALEVLRERRSTAHKTHTRRRAERIRLESVAAPKGRLGRSER